jgi:hypothetical protein
MLTIKCNLKFADGAVVTGELTAESPEDQYAVRYTGPVERLPRKLETSDAGFLEFFFKKAATESGAEVSIEYQGEFDRWAE